MCGSDLLHVGKAVLNTRAKIKSLSLVEKIIFNTYYFFEWISFLVLCITEIFIKPKNIFIEARLKIVVKLCGRSLR